MDRSGSLAGLDSGCRFHETFWGVVEAQLTDKLLPKMFPRVQASHVCVSFHAAESRLKG